ncbi:hypothetical protein HY634_03865 [Candidatus Uhrbacteria bacterium]|nr:hypothetical protein [Candidatus Uhrbacteria bacterium]
MRKFIAGAIALGALVVGVAIVRATPTSEITIEQHAVTATTVYGGQPDVLGIDLTMRAPRGDVLDTLFVRQEGTAQWQIDLADAALWVDRGALGFQGIGVDRKVASGVWVASESGWAFDRVWEPVSEAGTRLFVTVSTVAQPTDQATIRLQLPGFRDEFQSMSYDTGDRGVFLRTARAAPLVPIVSTATHIVNRRATDDLAPIVRITEPVDGAAIAQNWMIVRGIAKDLGGSAPSRVLVGLNRPGRAITWVDAVPESSAFATWEARFFEFARPQAYEIRVQAEDWAGNRSAVSVPVTVTLTEISN